MDLFGAPAALASGAELPHPGIVRADYRQLKDKPDGDDSSIPDIGARFALGHVFYDPSCGQCYQSKETDENFYSAISYSGPMVDHERR